MISWVIYVEDEPDDAFFMERAFRQCAPECELKIISNGQEALQYFTSRDGAGEAPGLVLLDLNLPGRSGLDILREIRQKPQLRIMPVIMFTSSNQEIDIAEAYHQGCSGYLVKPRNSEKLRTMVSALTEFWLKENQYPPLGI